MIDRFEWLMPRAGLTVIKPFTRGQKLDPLGERVRLDSYWTHLLNDPDQPVLVTTVAESDARRAATSAQQIPAAEAEPTPTKAPKAAKETP